MGQPSGKKGGDIVTAAERRHAQLEETVAAALEEQGFSLHRQGGLYQVEDSDLQPVTDLVELSEIIAWIESW